MTLNVTDDVMREILSKLTLEELRVACKTTKQTYRICSSVSFWAIKAKKDFGVTLENFNNLTEAKKFGVPIDDFIEIPGKTRSPMNVYFEYKTISDIYKVLIQVYQLATMEIPMQDSRIFVQRAGEVKTYMQKIKEILETYENSTQSAKNILDQLALLYVIRLEDTDINKERKALYRYTIDIGEKIYVFLPVYSGRHRIGEFLIPKYRRQLRLIKELERLRFIGLGNIEKEFLKNTAFIHLGRLGKIMPEVDLDTIARRPLLEYNSIFE